MKRFMIWVFMAALLTLTACFPQETEPITITPPVAESEPGDTAVPVQPTAAIAANTETPPTAPTAVPTALPTDQPAPTPSPTPVPPTPTPFPTVANGVTFETILPGGDLFRPVYLTHAGDDRLFIVTQTGTIRIMQDGQLLGQPFLDIEDQVNSNANEQGLLSVAFHPNYAENGRFFINYTREDGSTVVSRWQVSADPNVADAGSEQVMLVIGQPYGNHNGGQIKFGPDGMLYIGMGDGGSADDPQGNGQNPGTLLGAMLRIDVNYEASPYYAVPASNPFVNDDAVRNEIWAIGLRNPWRFSFDRATGDLFIADVGQNTYEEVSFQPAGSSGGENYGWNVMEGMHCFRANCDQTGLVLPIFEYNHSQGCSITGGYVYRGAAYPALVGNYFVTDYCSGQLWAIVPQPDGNWQTELIGNSGVTSASFGEDVNGELYLLDHAGGAIFRMVGE